MHGERTEERLERLGLRARDAAARAVRAQWTALGAPVDGDVEGGVMAVVDPEALVLATLGLVDHDRELVEPLTWWSAEGPGLMSVQRTRNLSASYPGRVRHRLAEFAGSAWKVGGDHRWKVLADERTGVAASSGASVRLVGPAGVMLRLRLGLGVGIKADVLTVLLGLEGWHTVRALKEAAGYTTRAVRRAASELARGGWIEASPASPAEYRAGSERWLPLLELEAPAPWRHWHARLSFVLVAAEWLTREEGRDDEVGRAESARALADAHRLAFKWSGVAVPDPGDRDYVSAFGAAVADLLPTLGSAL